MLHAFYVEDVAIDAAVGWAAAHMLVDLLQEVRLLALLQYLLPAAVEDSRDLCLGDAHLVYR